MGTLNSRVRLATHTIILPRTSPGMSSYSEAKCSNNGVIIMQNLNSK